MVEELKEKVFKANLDLVKHGLVIFTWGNVSAIDRKKGLVVIKPSGVSYETMKTSDMALPTVTCSLHSVTSVSFGAFARKIDNVLFSRVSTSP